MEILYEYYDEKEDINYRVTKSDKRPDDKTHCVEVLRKDCSGKYCWFLETFHPDLLSAMSAI